MYHCFDKIVILNSDIDEPDHPKEREIRIQEVEYINSEDGEKETADNGKERY